MMSEKFSPSFTDTYFRTIAGNNCHPDSVVSTAAKCKQAASQLGLSYINKFWGSHHPAGCMFHASSNFLSIPIFSASFNSIVDPAKTSNIYESYGGICIGGT